ncbi:MAG: ABC transporter permease [Lachnospiraceae bacterium]|nr:ABC transporter permease [Lachnospiraceae bacterium]
MFKNLLKSESQKLLFHKWIWITTIATVLFVPLMVYSLGALGEETGIDLYISKFLQSFYLGQVGVVVIAALYFGQEFSNSTLRTSLTAVPNRFLFLLSKFLCLMAWCMMTLLMSTAISFIVLKCVFYADLDMNTIGTLINALFPAYISSMELCMITAGMIIISKSMVVSLAIMLSMLLGLGHLLMQYSSIMRFLPVLSTMNSFLLFHTNEYLPLWQGILCQGVWGIGLVVISNRVLRSSSYKGYEG